LDCATPTLGDGECECITTGLGPINTSHKVYIDKDGWLVGQTLFESYVPELVDFMEVTYFRYRLYGMLQPDRTIEPGFASEEEDNRCDGGTLLWGDTFVGSPEFEAPVNYGSRWQFFGIELQNRGGIENWQDPKSVNITSVWIMIDINAGGYVPLAANGDIYDFCVLGEHILNDDEGVHPVVDRFSTRFTGAMNYEGSFKLEEDGKIEDALEATARGDVVEQIDINACLTRDWEVCYVDQNEPYRVGEDFGLLLNVTQDNFEKYKITQIWDLKCGKTQIELISGGKPKNVLTLPNIDSDGSAAYVRSAVQIAFFENNELETNLECVGSVKLQSKDLRKRELEYEMESAFSSVSRGMQKAEEGSFGLSIIIQDDIDEAAGAGGNAGVATAATAAAFFVGILLV